MHWATTVISTAKPSSSASVPRRVGDRRPAATRPPRVGAGAGHQSASRQSTPGSDDEASSGSTSSMRSCPPWAGPSVAGGRGRPGAERQGRRRSTAVAGARRRGRGRRGQSGSRWSRSASRMRSASCGSSAVMPPRTRLRAAGGQVGDREAGVLVELEEVEADDRDVQAAEDGDLLAVAGAVDADEPVPEGPE